MSEPEKLLTIREVMTLLHVHRGLPYKWNQEGVLKAVVLPGGSLRWRPSDIVRMIARESA